MEKQEAIKNVSFGKEYSAEKSEVAKDLSMITKLAVFWLVLEITLLGLGG